MKIRQTKAISAVIATIMLLMVTVSLIGVFYVFSSTLATTTTGSGSEQASQLAAQLSMCMQVDNIAGNQIILRNCGKGVIENNSLVVTIDNIKAAISADTIQENSAGTVNVTIPGAWNMSQANPSKKYSLVISNGAATAQALVELTRRKSDLAGYWNFEEGSGITAADASGRGNAGTLKNLTSAACFVNGACPDWVDGKFGNALQFDGTNDYVDAGNGANLTSDEISIGFWFKPSTPLINQETMIGKLDTIGKGYSIRMYGTSGVLEFELPNVYAYHAFQTGSIISHNNWYYVMTTYSKTSGVAKIYVNNLVYTKSGLGGTIGTSSNNLWFGNDPGATTHSFNGTIDEVRVWNKALAPDETVGLKQII